MSEPVTTQELNIQEQKQECGCGCGGYQSSTAKQDCGCGGDSCGGWQELALVDSPRLTGVRQLATSKVCDCWTE